MASPAQCIANAQNATHSTGPKSAEGKSVSAYNSVSPGLFAAYGQLAPENRELIDRYVEDMHAGIPQQGAAFEHVIREFAIATWRMELCHQLEASFFSNAVAVEKQDPESAALIQKLGEHIILGLAITRDAKGPKVFSKLQRYRSSVTKELKRAREAYALIVVEIDIRNHKTKPISMPKASSPPPEPCEPPADTPRNSPCPCGSGQKYKRCCLVRHSSKSEGGGVTAPAVLGRTSTAASGSSGHSMQGI